MEAHSTNLQVIRWPVSYVMTIFYSSKQGKNQSNTWQRPTFVKFLFLILIHVRLNLSVACGRLNCRAYSTVLVITVERGRVCFLVEFWSS